DSRNLSDARCRSAVADGRFWLGRPRPCPPDRVRGRLRVLGPQPSAWPLATLAQQQAMPVIGFLFAQPADGSRNFTVRILQSLKETGYVEGQNVAIEYRSAARGGF